MPFGMNKKEMTYFVERDTLNTDRLLLDRVVVFYARVWSCYERTYCLTWRAEVRPRSVDSRWRPAVYICRHGFTDWKQEQLHDECRQSSGRCDGNVIRSFIEQQQLTNDPS